MTIEDLIRGIRVVHKPTGMYFKICEYYNDKRVICVDDDGAFSMLPLSELEIVVVWPSTSKCGG
ncbi:hypothetical protein V1481_02675 [Aeromonas enteropelogenes]|uniref:hypothetical protein n=1 Tax=Aeromonas enteropelogenes TaxID=29489 RepID=UPI003136E970